MSHKNLKRVRYGKKKKEKAFKRARTGIFLMGLKAIKFQLAIHGDSNLGE